MKGDTKIIECENRNYSPFFDHVDILALPLIYIILNAFTLIVQFQCYLLKILNVVYNKTFCYKCDPIIVYLCISHDLFEKQIDMLRYTKNTYAVFREESNKFSKFTIIL